MQSVRKELIAILNNVAATKEFPLFFTSENSTPDEVRLVCELIDRDLLDGAPMKSSKGVPIQAAVTGITIGGREYVDELEQKQFEKSAGGKLVTFLKYGAVFILGIIGTLLTQWLAKTFGLN